MGSKVVNRSRAYENAQVLNQAYVSRSTSFSREKEFARDSNTIPLLIRLDSTVYANQTKLQNKKIVQG